MYSLICDTISDVNGDTYKFIWTINNFMENTNQIREFRTDKSNDGRPQLKLQMVGQEKSILELSFMFPSYLVTSASVTDNLERKTPLATFYSLVVEANKWVYLKTVSKKEIESYMKFKGPNFCYRLSSTFNVQQFINVESNNKDTKNSLNSDFEQILKLEDGVDVVIKSKEGKEYNVHKLVLMTRSVVLKAVFDFRATETQTNVVDSPFESDVLEQVLSYIYTDKVPKIKKLARRILVAADYYQLEGLKTLCVEEIGENLPEQIAMELLELADSCQAKGLEQAASKFLKKMQFFAAHTDDNDWEVVNCTF